MGRASSGSFSVAFAIFFCSALLVVDSKTDYLKRLRYYTHATLIPLRAIPNNLHNVAEWIGQLGVFHLELIEENNRLITTNSMLKAHTQKYISLKHENDRLRNLLGVIEKTKVNRVTVAELEAAQTNGFEHSVWINAGSLEGVYTGQPVVDSEGIYGIVAEVGLASSKVNLVTAQSFTLSVSNLRNGERGLLFGSGSDLDLRFILSNKDIRKDDLLVTSGLDGIFPANYPVAKVTTVEHVPGGFARIRALPLANVTTAYQVLLLWVNKKS